MKKILIFIVLTLVWIVLLLPKETLFNQISKELKIKENIQLNVKNSKDSGYKLSLKDIYIDYMGMKIAHIDKTEILPWLFYNNAKIKDIEINLFENRYKIETADLLYTVLNPTVIKISGKSQFGNFSGFVDLKEHKISLVIDKGKLNDKFLDSFLKKQKNGGVGFEYKY